MEGAKRDEEEEVGEEKRESGTAHGGWAER